MRRTLVVRAVLCLLVLVMAAWGSGWVAGATRSTGPVALQPLPAKRLRHCRRSALLRPVCPLRVPRAAWYLSHLSWSGAPHTVTQGLDVFDLEHGGEDPRRPGKARPPALVHLTLYGGNLRVGFPFRYPARARPTRARAGLVRLRRTRPLYLGRARWAGRSGTLVLAPPFLFGGQMGNHLIFRWRERRIEYALGLHAWEPFPETVATLRAVIASIR